MEKTQKFINRTVIMTGLLLGSFALAVAAGSWTSPAGSPPNNNVDAPINIGDSIQYKKGALGIGDGTIPAGSLFTTFGVGAISTFFADSVDTKTLKVTQAPVGGIKKGMVLMAVDEDGSAVWATPAETPIPPTPSKVCAENTFIITTDHSVGNNSSGTFKLATLLPGAYKITGSGSDYDTGGGGIALITMTVSGVSPADNYAGGNSGDAPASIMQTATYPALLWIKRYGGGGTNWTVDSSFSLTRNEDMNLTLGQGGVTGNLMVRYTPATCGN